MNSETMFYRVVHDSWISGDKMSSVVFRPMLVDGQLLPVFDGDQITLEDAWYEFTNHFHGSSPFLGIVGVTLAECNSLELSVLASPDIFPARAYIDFTGLSRGQIRRKAHMLKEYANSRGWLFQS